MTDFSKIDEEFEEAVEIRKELNTVHHKDFAKLGKVFGALFGVNNNTLKLLSDMNYYRGGYPGENSPPKLDALFDKAGTVIRFYEAVGRLDEINEVLAKYGFEVTKKNHQKIEASRAALEETPAMTRATNLAYERGFVWSDDISEMIEWFLNHTENLQGTICEMADNIKIELFSRVESKIDGAIDKSGFNTAVNTVAKKRIKEESHRDTGSLIEKGLEKSELLVNDGDFLREKLSEKAKTPV